MALTKITSDVIAAGAVESTHIASGAISSSHLSSITTDNVSEGSTNTYFTNARARGSVSVTGGGLSYDSGTGVIQIASIPNASLANSSLTVNSNSVSLGGSVTLDTDDIGEGSTNLYFTNARAQGAISGGTGVTVSSGEISIGQDVATSSTPTFGNITTTGYIAGPATFTIDPAAVGNNTGTVVIAGNLQVDGTTTTINSTTMTVDDLNITLASGAANAAAADGAGITVDCGSDTDATFTYDGTNDEWDFNKDINVTGTVTADGLDINVGTNNVGATFTSTDQQVLLALDDSLKTTTIESNNGILKFGTNGASGGTSATEAMRIDRNQLVTCQAGIDVTGTVTADGLTVDGNATINGTTPILYLTESDTTDLNSRIRNSAGNLQIHTANDAQNSFTARVNISHSTGDVSFYEDTGTTAKLFWDASAETLAIGDMPTVPKDTALLLRSNSDSHAITIYEPVGANENWQLGVDADGDLGFYNSASTTASVTFNDSGNVGIGTDNPGHPLNVVDSGELQAEFSGYSHASAANNSRAASGSIRLGNGAGTTGLLIDYTDQGQTVGLIKNEYVASGDSELRLQSPFLSFYTGTSAAEAMRVDSSGNVGIGTTNPTGKLTIANPTAYAPNTVTAANSYIQLGSTDYGSGGSGNSDGKFMIGFGYTDGTTNTHSPAYIGFEETSTSGDTKGNLTFYTRNVITDTAPIKRMTINAAGGLSINDDVETPLSINRTTTTTGASYMTFTNGGGNAFVGVDSSLGNRMFVGGGSANAYALTLTTESAHPILFATNNSQRMTIASDGKIDMYPSGAETTGGLRVVYNGDNNYEVARFQADGNQDAHVSFVSNGTTGYYWGIGIDYSDSGAFKISNDNLLATNGQLRIGTNGDVSFAANATGAALIKGVSGNQADRNAGGYPQYTFVGNEGTGMRRVASNELAFDTSGDERVRIDSNGNVGIGYLAENPPDTLMVKNTTGSQKILMHAASETANRGVALGMTVTGTGGAAAIYGTTKDLSSVTENLIFNPDGGPILMGAVPQSASPAHVTIDGRGDADTFRLSFDYGHPTMTSRGANLDFRLGNASASATRITTNYWPGGSGDIDISAYGHTNQILLHEGDSGMVEFSDGYVKLGGYSYIGEDLVDNDSLHLMSDYTENIIFGQRDRVNNTWTESFRIDRYGNMNAPGTIIQTVRADANNVVGTGDFDVISVNITPKFANSDMIIHFYTQWSVSTNNGEDWGMKLLRDGTTVQGDTINGYFISGGGVDASDNPLAQTSYSAPQYYVRTACKTDIDTGRSSSTAQMTYKIRKVVPAGTSTKTVRFGVDGWTGGTVEANRSRIVLMVQEVMPN